MGYRLEMSKARYAASGGKLYGYVVDDTLKNFKSYQWLLGHQFIDGDEDWTWGDSPCIKLLPYQFKEFIKLYNEDWNSVGNEKDCIINNEKIQELIKSEEDVLLEWG